MIFGFRRYSRTSGVMMLSSHSTPALTWEDGQTVGGWVDQRVGRVPGNGETWEIGRFRLVVERVRRRRVERVYLERVRERAGERA